PIPSGAAYRQKFTLLSSNPQTDYVDKKWLQTGMDIKSGTSIIGEFTQKLPGLGKMADKLEMFESLSSATGRSHTITKRADQTSVDGKIIDFASDSQGNPKDIIAFYPERKGSNNKISPQGIHWEPYVDFMLSRKMLADKTFKYHYGKAGISRDGGSKYEYKRMSDGVIQRMRKHGNWVPYNRGEFSGALLRSVFGDLFYGRVSMQDRHVKLYTNEAGFNTFQ